MVPVFLVELEAKEGPADVGSPPRQGANPLMSLCWCFLEDFYLVPARNWWEAGPAGTSKVPDGHQRLAWAMASPLLLGLPAKPDLYGSIESLYAAASFILYDLSAVQSRLGELGSTRKSPSTVWCCNGERRGCSLGRYGPHFALLGENPMRQLCCSLSHILIAPATSLLGSSSSAS